MSTHAHIDLAGALSRIGAATLGESGAQVAHPRLRPIWAGATVCAPAYPVRCTPGDNLALHVAVTRAPRGSVLVADVGDLAERGYWGEVLTTAAEAKGLVGLVIDGGVRDVAALEAHRFAVFATVVALAGATKDKGWCGGPAGNGRRRVGGRGRLGCGRCGRGGLRSRCRARSGAGRSRSASHSERCAYSMRSGLEPRSSTSWSWTRRPSTVEPPVGMNAAPPGATGIPRRRRRLQDSKSGLISLGLLHDSREGDHAGPPVDEIAAALQVSVRLLVQRLRQSPAVEARHHIL